MGCTRTQEDGVKGRDNTTTRNRYVWATSYGHDNYGPFSLVSFIDYKAFPMVRTPKVFKKGGRGFGRGGGAIPATRIGALSAPTIHPA